MSQSTIYTEGNIRLMTARTVAEWESANGNLAAPRELLSYYATDVGDNITIFDGSLAELRANLSQEELNANLDNIKTVYEQIKEIDDQLTADINDAHQTDLQNLIDQYKQDVSGEIARVREDVEAHLKQELDAQQQIVDDKQSQIDTLLTNFKNTFDEDAVGMLNEFKGKLGIIGGQPIGIHKGGSSSYSTSKLGLFQDNMQDMEGAPKVLELFSMDDAREHECAIAVNADGSKLLFLEGKQVLAADKSVETEVRTLMEFNI